MPTLPGEDLLCVQAAARTLAGGGLVAFPTETVYGLGARADDAAAVGAIFAAKGRPSDHPLIVHVCDAAGAEAFCEDLPPLAQRLMSACWPGPLTLVVRRRAGIAREAAGGQDTVGLRCPDHPVAQALLRQARLLGVPGVAAPSANRFGRVSPTRAEHVEAEFGPALCVLDGGPCREGLESAIVDCSREVPYLLRPGTLGRAVLEQWAGQALQQPDRASPRVSGALASHYAPRARVALLPGGDLPAWVRSQQAGAPAAVPLGVYSRQPLVVSPGVLYRQMPDNAARVAQELFAVLRSLDDAGVVAIGVEAPPSSPEWEAVRDRLQRAAAH